jgi:uncharacterized protein involved in exopolysaccharide biosynthesis
METNNFDMLSIFKTILNKRKFILSVAVIAAMVAILFTAIKKPIYKAETAFFVSNPLVADRANVYQFNNAFILDHFAEEKDVDKVMAIANGAVLRDTLIARMQLDAHYNLSLQDPKSFNELHGKIQNNFNIKRTENTNLEVSFKDHDPQFAATCANAIAQTIADLYQAHYNQTRLSIHKTLAEKVSALDQEIKTMSDSLAVLRNRTGVYDLIAPNRKNTVQGTIHSNGSASFASDLEALQNIEAIKDQLVIDRANTTTLLNQFATATTLKEIPLIKIISKAYTPTKSTDLGFLVNALVAFLLALFFSAVLVVLQHSLKQVLKA